MLSCKITYLPLSGARSKAGPLQVSGHAVAPLAARGPLLVTEEIQHESDVLLACIAISAYTWDL
jgi:hypothetical protein